MLESGNFNGNFVVSISYANTIGSAGSMISSLRVIIGGSLALLFTEYQVPQKILESIDTRT